MILRVILVAIVLLLLVRAIGMIMRGIAIGAGQQAGRRPPSRPVKLTRDPVCGTHVTPRTSLSLTAGGSTHYFCSEECRKAFQRR